MQLDSLDSLGKRRGGIVGRDFVQIAVAELGGGYRQTVLSLLGLWAKENVGWFAL